jgi:hypothetical protein
MLFFNTSHFWAQDVLDWELILPDFPREEWDSDIALYALERSKNIIVDNSLGHVLKQIKDRNQNSMFLVLEGINCHTHRLSCSVF